MLPLRWFERSGRSGALTGINPVSSGLTIMDELDQERKQTDVAAIAIPARSAMSLSHEIYFC